MQLLISRKVIHLKFLIYSVNFIMNNVIVDTVIILLAIVLYLCFVFGFWFKISFKFLKDLLLVERHLKVIRERMYMKVLSIQRVLKILLSKMIKKKSVKMLYNLE